MNPTTKHLVIIAVVCWLTFFLYLGYARLWDRDEPRNVGCAAEMLAAGNWSYRTVINQPDKIWSARKLKQKAHR